MGRPTVKKEPPAQGSAFMLTLGCDKNRVDGEAMGGTLLDAGFALTHDPSLADFLIVNTCGFISDASQESVEAIVSLAKHKQESPEKLLIVAGCMAERYRSQIKTEIPEADVVIGTNEYHKIAETIAELISRKSLGGLSAKESIIRPPREFDAESFYAKRLLLPVMHTVPVKIAEGCDNRCAYCVIPSLRGPYRSRPFEKIVGECRELVGGGARELVLVAQDTAYYGVDLYGNQRLHELLDEISKIEGPAWVRFMYANPARITDELLRTVASNKKICKYIDMPIQHSSESVLRRMGRSGSETVLRDIVKKIRETVPGVSIRTTLMVGYPGETEDEFESLMKFAAETRFDRLGVFAYSREEGTPASKLPGQVKKAVRDARLDMLMKSQQAAHASSQKNLIGKTMDVMVDGETEGGPREYEGRSQADAPECDTVVLFKAKRGHIPGDVVSVKITGSDEYDLYGEEAG